MKNISVLHHILQLRIRAALQPLVGEPVTHATKNRIRFHLKAAGIFNLIDDELYIVYKEHDMSTLTIVDYSTYQKYLGTGDWVSLK